MPLVINTNVQSLNAQRLLTKNSSQLSRSYERIASGFRINRAADDAAGLQISEILRTQIRGSQRALDNVQDGINIMNVVDGTISTITDSLQRMRELVVQAANDTYSALQRSAIKSEIVQLANDITRMSQATNFNGNNLLDGSLSHFYLQVGANKNSAVDRIDVASVGGVNPFANVSAGAMFLGSDASAIGIGSNTSALRSLSRLDAAINNINNRRAILGAAINRLESAASNLSIAIENISSSESRIRNADVAKENADLTRNQILQQASATILQQANQSPQLALQLLGGG
jgi:flagellin